MGYTTGKRWTDEVIEAELRDAIRIVGRMPSNSELIAMGKPSLGCAIGRLGGFRAWSNRLGVERKPSDSDTGWEGEDKVLGLFVKQGIVCEKSGRTKAPYDLLVQGALRVDVKSARYAEYGRNYACRGWFYRIGKNPAADLLFLYQLDTGTFYGIPWWICPTTNITISRSGGKWAGYLNNWPLIRGMIGWRMAEQARCGSPVAEVA